MLSSVALLVCSLPPVAVDTAEYVFKNVRAAYFAEKRWSTLAEVAPGYARVDAPSPAGRAKWIWFDAKGNRAVIAADDDSARTVANILAEFDVAPKIARFDVRLARCDWGVSTKSVIETPNNGEATFGSKELDLALDLKPRINNDGSMSVWVTVRHGAKPVALVFRLRNEGRIYVRDGRAFSLAREQRFHIPEDGQPEGVLPSRFEIDIVVGF